MKNKAADTCWVYILETDEGSRSVCYTMNIERVLDTFPDNTRLVFCRRFEDITSGLSYKLFLENLSPQSLERTIRNEELRMKN